MTPRSWACAGASAICAPRRMTGSDGNRRWGSVSEGSRRCTSAKADDGFRGQSALGDHLGEQAAVHELHRDERMAVRFADFVDRADVRVCQVRGRAGLVEQARALVRPDLATADDLDRDGAVELLVLRAIHDAHAAGAEARPDPVMAEGLANHREGSLKADG